MNKKNLSSDDWKTYKMGAEFLPKKHLINNKKDFKRKKFNLAPIPIIAAKDDSSLFFRTYSYVDKQKLKILEKHINDNKKDICEFLEEVEKKENISQYQIFHKVGQTYEFLNLIELKPIGKNPHITYKKNTFNTQIKSLDYRYYANIDISKFYESIYTHSFTWITNHNFSKEKFLEELDKKVQNINGNITSGIPTGPICSKIISEILLTSIMLDISDDVKDEDCHIYRFADDFIIYYNKKSDLNKIARKIASILIKYKLSINEKKWYINNNKNKYKIINGYQYNNKWHVKYDGILYKISDNKKINEFLETKILSQITELSNFKEKISFYRYIFKVFLNDELNQLIIKNKKLLTIFISSAINYILISDISLNTPFMLLESFLENVDNEKKLFIYKKLKKIYKETNSTIKKIFIFDFLFNNNEHEIDQKYYVNHLQLLLKNKTNYIHISQLLEAEVIKFSDLLQNINKPTFNKYTRLSEEWVIWIYADKEGKQKLNKSDKTAYNKMLILWTNAEYKKYKPFHYNNS